MLRNLLFWAAVVLGFRGAAAQDMILLRTAEEIRAMVIEITDTEIKYRNFGQTDGPVRALSRDKVFSVSYANGEKDVFKPAQPRAGAYPYPRVSRSYRVGELFDEGGVRGLVVSTTDGGRHGLLLSLEEGGCVWGGAWGQEQTETFRTFECFCRSLDDGWANMQAVAEVIGHTTGLTWANFPAFDWCRSLGPGWYLPAYEEICCLWNFGPANPAMSVREHSEAVYALTALLESAGGERMRRMSYYWTSSEDGSAEQARVWAPRPDKYKYFGKRFGTAVRAFHKF